MSQACVIPWLRARREPGCSRELPRRSHSPGLILVTVDRSVRDQIWGRGDRSQARHRSKRQGSGGTNGGTLGPIPQGMFKNKYCLLNILRDLYNFRKKMKALSKFPNRTSRRNGHFPLCSRPEIVNHAPQREQQDEIIFRE